VKGLQLRYFVLKPKGTDRYAKASRAAMRRYAKLIQEENPELAQDLREWAEREQIDPFEERENG
jgi:hypothetical protein